MIQLFLFLISLCLFKSVFSMEVASLDTDFFSVTKLDDYKHVEITLKDNTHNAKKKQRVYSMNKDSIIAANNYIKKNPQDVIEYAKKNNIEVVSQAVIDELILAKQKIDQLNLQLEMKNKFSEKFDERLELIGLKLQKAHEDRIETLNELERSKEELTRVKASNDELVKQVELAKQIENKRVDIDNALASLRLIHQTSIDEMNIKLNICTNEKTKLQEESINKDRFIARLKILNGVLILGILLFTLFSCRNFIKNGFYKIWELRHAVPSVSFKKPNITFSGFSNPFAHVDIANWISFRWALLRNYIGI